VKCLSQFLVRGVGPDHSYTFDGAPLGRLEDQRSAGKKVQR